MCNDDEFLMDRSVRKQRSDLESLKQTVSPRYCGSVAKLVYKAVARAEQNHQTHSTAQSSNHNPNTNPTLKMKCIVLALFFALVAITSAQYLGYGGIGRGIGGGYGLGGGYGGKNIFYILNMLRIYCNIILDF